MRKLFDKTSINQMELKNRFVRSATWEGLANPDGSCGDKVTAMIEELALGQVALIISSHAYVNPEGKGNNGQLGMHDDSLIASYQKTVQVVQEKGSKIILQISHAGGRAISQNPYGPSPTNIPGYQCREITLAEIAKIIHDFKKAALRARKAGFDGIQIHAAHGFLLSQFLSPFFNKRKDYYGGSIENRARIILEIVQIIRSELGNRFVITIKINSDDFIDGGFQPEEMIQVSELLEKAGLDALEMSGGTSVGKYSSHRVNKDVLKGDEVYYRDAAKLFKEKINIPLILVGGIRSYEVARELIEDDFADYISLSRPLIREPYLIRRWQSGDTRRATCISCNKCFAPAREGKGLYCMLDK
jgi:2,4-dienoyl-CoA reductase-like NADH-dependent reductase (Old Yellow Enzyme family)